MNGKNIFYKVVKRKELVLGYDYAENYSLDDIVQEYELKDHLLHSKETFAIYDLFSNELLHIKEETGRYGQ